MSELRTVEIEFPESNESILLDALKEMGYKPEIHQQGTQLRSYYGSQTKKAHIVVRKEQFGGYTDVGFERKNGKYDVHIDSMDNRKFGLNKLKQNFFVSSIKDFIKGRSKYSLREKQELKKEEKIRLIIDVNY